VRKIPINRRRIRESEPDEMGCDEMKRQGRRSRGGVLRTQFEEHWQELENGTGPAVKQQDRDCGRVRGKQSKEVDVIGFGVVIGNGDFVLRKRVESGFPLSPTRDSVGKQIGKMMFYSAFLPVVPIPPVLRHFNEGFS
jgi:hypothetical protein